MNDREKIAKLREMLDLMMGWAREIPSEVLDGDPQMRLDFRRDLAEATDLLKATSA